jgi:hypothetical protein
MVVNSSLTGIILQLLVGSLQFREQGLALNPGLLDLMVGADKGRDNDAAGDIGQ